MAYIQMNILLYKQYHLRSDTINVSAEDGRIIIDGIGGNQLPIATSEVLGCIKVGNGPINN